MRLKPSPWLYFLSVVCVLLSTFSLAQARAKDRIVSAISSSESTMLSGNVHPKARAEFDRGRVADDLPLERITLVFKPTQAQQTPSMGNTSVTGTVTVQATSGSLTHFARVTVTLN